MSRKTSNPRNNKPITAGFTIEPVAAPSAYPQIEQQAAELEAVRRMLTASRSTFSLSLAVCNSPALRDHLLERLASFGPNLQVVALPGGTVDVFGVVRDKFQSRSSALCVVGLEASLPSAASVIPALESLNASRELWKTTFPVPVIFWLPEFAACLLLTHARDFWRWFSHQFQFVSEQAGLQSSLQDAFAGDVHLAASLDADRKRFRIAELQQRLAGAGADPAPSLIPHVAQWLNELAYLHDFLGETQSAEEVLRSSLALHERINNMEGVAADYGNLGLIYLTRGDLDEAERLLRKSLEIHEKLGRLEGMANDYGNLGVIYRTRGDLDEAERLLRKSLEIEEKLGRLEGMAKAYGNLGVIHQIHGDLDQAEQMHRKSLEIEEKLGRLEGMAVDYGNLGVIRQIHGDLVEAERLHRKSLEIHEKLGRLEGMAVDYGNLALIYRTRGDLVEAERLFRKSLEINEKLGRLEGIAKAHVNLGSVLLMRGDANAAAECWAKARALFAKIPIPREVEQLDRVLGQLQEAALSAPSASEMGLLENCRERLTIAFGKRFGGLLAYGSRVREDSVADSDLDLLILLEPPVDLGKDLETAVRTLYPVQLSVNYPIHPLPVSVDSFEAGRTALLRAAREEGIRL